MIAQAGIIDPILIGYIREHPHSTSTELKGYLEDLYPELRKKDGFQRYSKARVVVARRLLALVKFGYIERHGTKMQYTYTYKE